MPMKKSIKPRKNPLQARSQATVDSILEATTHILIHQGYDHMSTNAIAQKAGVSIGSLYQFFPNKEAVVAALIDRQIEEEMHLITTKLADLADAPLAHAARELVKSMLLMSAVNPKLKVALYAEIPRVGRFERLRETRRFVEQMIFDFLERHQDEVKPKNRKLAAFLIVQAVDAVIQNTKQEHPDYLQDEAFIHEINALVIRYLCKEV